MSFKDAITASVDVIEKSSIYSEIRGGWSRYQHQMLLKF
jgi:hypothetical protein